MAMPQQLITTLDDLPNTKYIKKDTKTFIKDNLEIIKEYATKEETKQINTAIKLVSKQDLKAQDKKSYYKYNQM